MDKLNKWMSLVADIGVVAGIVFLAYEIRVNTSAVNAESAASYASVVMDAGVFDPEFVRILTTVNSEGWQGVADDARQLALVRTLQTLKHTELAYIQWTEGSLDDRLWEGNDRGTYQMFWGNRVMRDGWRTTVRNNFSIEFQRYVDAVIHDVCARRECYDIPGLPKPNPDMISGMNAWSARS